MNAWKVLLLLISLGLLTYGHSLNADFEFDDYRGIVENTYIKHGERPDRIFQNEDTTRFLPNLTFALNYRLSGLNVFGFHLTNVLLHLLASLLVFGLVRVTFKTPELKNDPLFRDRDGIALFSSLIFFAHPVQTEAVTYIVQRSTCMATLFYFAAVLLYAQARLGTKHAPLFLGTSYLATLAGAFSKPIVFTLPLAIVAYEVYFFPKNFGEIKKTAGRVLPYFAVMVLLAFIALSSQTRSMDPRRFGAIVDLGSKLAPGEYLLTQCNVIRTYLRLLVFPWGQTLEYDYPVSRSLFEIQTLASLGLLVFTFLGIFRWFKKQRLLSFSILWFFMTLLVEASVIPLPDVIFEHRLYLPLFGFALFASAAAFTRARSTRQAQTVLIFFLAFLSGATFLRNKTWQDQVVFMENAARKAPAKPRVIYNLARAYHRKQDLDQAETYYQRTLALSPDDADTYNSLGELYQQKNDAARAEPYFRKALALQPNHEMALINLGVLLRNQGHPMQAMEHYGKALTANPNSAIAHNNIGNIYCFFRRRDAAEDHYRTAAEMNPDLRDVFFNRGNNFFEMRAYTQAIEQYRKAIRLGPDAETFQNLADAYRMAGDTENAGIAAKKASILRAEENALPGTDRK